MSLSPSYDKARELLASYSARGLTFMGPDLTKAQLYATLAVAESLMAIEGLLRAQDARVRKAERNVESESEI